MISSDKTNIVNYILKKHDIYTRYYAINEIYCKSVDTIISKIICGDYFFYI